jgi:hypothetical protein
VSVTRWAGCSVARRVVVVDEEIDRQAELLEKARIPAANLAECIPDAVGPRESADVAVVVSGRVDPARQDVRPYRRQRGDAQKLIAVLPTDVVNAADGWPVAE